MKSFKFVAALLVSLPLAGILVHFALDAGFIRLNYPSRDEFPVWGVDVSHHQGRVDWEKVKAEGFRFAIIKATEGGDFTDKRFAENWAGARAAGLVVGAYHFYTLCRPVADQLKHLTTVVPADPGALPPTLDLEFGGNCGQRPSQVDFDFALAELRRGVAAAYGRDPILYVTTEFFDAYLTNAGLDSDFWIRNVFRRPALATKRPWTFWQFANRGHVDGIDEVVDLNVFRGDEAQFAAFVRGTAPL